MSFLQEYFVYFKKAHEIRRKIIRSDADSYLISGYLRGSCHEVTYVSIRIFDSVYANLCVSDEVEKCAFLPQSKHYVHL